MKTLLCIDGNSILNRSFYGIRLLTTKDGVPTNALYGLTNVISRELEALKPDYAAIAYDLKAPTFRHNMYAEYKAGRHAMPDELRAQMPVSISWIWRATRPTTSWVPGPLWPRPTPRDAAPTF